MQIDHIYDKLLHHCLECELEMDQHIETYCMMKEDQWCDASDVAQHGRDGLNDECRYMSLVAFVDRLSEVSRLMAKLRIL